MKIILCFLFAASICSAAEPPLTDEEIRFIRGQRIETCKDALVSAVFAPEQPTWDNPIWQFFKSENVCNLKNKDKPDIVIDWIKKLGRVPSRDELENILVHDLNGRLDSLEFQSKMFAAMNAYAQWSRAKRAPEPPQLITAQQQEELDQQRRVGEFEAQSGRKVVWPKKTDEIKTPVKEKEPPKMPVYILADGRKIMAQSAIDSGEEWTIKDADGKFITVKKAEVLEIKKP